jgi:hypothetical protein
MKTNVGGIDRTLRIVAGAALMIWALSGGPVWAWIGVVPLLTGIVRFCPLYTAMGCNTCCKKGECDGKSCG